MPSMVPRTFNPRETEAGGYLQVEQGLHSELKASQNHMVRACLREKEKGEGRKGGEEEGGT